MSWFSEMDAEKMQEYLSSISTEELINELFSREGVAHYTINDDESYQIQKKDMFGKIKVLETYHGTVQILTISI